VRCTGASARGRAASPPDKTNRDSIATIAPATAGGQSLHCTFIEPLLFRPGCLEHRFYAGIFYRIAVSQDSDTAAAKCDAGRRIRMTHGYVVRRRFPVRAALDIASRRINITAPRVASAPRRASLRRQ
jgi:hypothetical protein